MEVVKFLVSSLILLVGHSLAAVVEWAGIFETPETDYQWLAQKVEIGCDMAYPDDTMKLAVLSVESASQTALDTLMAGDGADMLTSDCTTLENGGVIEVKADGPSCYNLVFDKSQSESKFPVQAAAAGAIAFFAQHFPIEFEHDKHYFKDSAEEDVEPVAQWPPSDGHAHGGDAGPFEWAGIFDTTEETYHWIAQKVDGKYADATMKLAAIPVTTAASAAGLFGAESGGKAAMGKCSCTTVEDGGEITAALDTCYLLTFDQSISESKFLVKPAGAQSIAFFTEHVPTEFENTKHYLQDLEGNDIEPVKQPAGFEGHDHGEGEETSDEEEFGRLCVCQSQKDNWEFNCDNLANMDEAINYLSTHKNECFSLNPSSTCNKWYHVVQAHHDHCLHDVLPKDIEQQLHYFEMLYQDCFVKRQFNPDLSVCPSVDCSDTAAMEQATEDLKTCEKTAEACAVALCSNAMKVVLMAHDTCPEDVLPTELELVLHDHEEPCAAQLCNSAAEAFDPFADACSAEVDAASVFGSWVPFLLAALAVFTSS